MFTLSMKTKKVLYLTQIFNLFFYHGHNSVQYIAFKVIHKVIVYFIRTFNIYTPYIFINKTRYHLGLDLLYLI